MDIYKSQETFEFNGKTYNKVLVTSNWNNIAVRQFETSFYNEYTIPEGSYDYNELVTEIVNVFNQFFIDNNISGSVQIDKFKFNSTDTGTLINSLLYPVRYVELVAMENGLQKILPFTVPMMYCHDKDYENTIYPEKYKNYDIIYMFDEVFDLIWLNDNFAEVTESYNVFYPNCFFGSSCNYNGTWAESDDFGSIIPDNTNGNYNRSVYFCNNVYNVYGLCIMLLVSLCNSDIVNLGARPGYGNMSRFLLTVDGDWINITRNNTDSKWSIIYANGLFSDHISNYQIKYFDPVNWANDDTIRINFRPNNMTMLKNNNFNYHCYNQLMYTNNNGEIDNTALYNSGVSMIYNIDNTLVNVKNLINPNSFFAHFASFDITAVFTSPNIIADYNIYCNLSVDNVNVLNYSDSFKNTSNKSVRLSVPRKYFGKGKHNIIVSTNAESITYTVNEWSMY